MVVHLFFIKKIFFLFVINPNSTIFAEYLLHKLLKMKKIFTSIVLLNFSVLVAQNNELLNPDFWKGKPTVEQVKQKISKGNDPTEPNERAFDPVTLAILNEAPNETIEYLLSLNGNDVTKPTHHKRTYIFWSLMRKNMPITKLLLEKGADPNAIDSYQNTPIIFAAERGNISDLEFYKLLVKKGANLKHTNENGTNVLLTIVPHVKNIDEIRYFTKRGLSLNSVDNNGNNAIFYAARSGSQNIIDQLIKKKIPYKITNNKGENLMFAAAEGTRTNTNNLAFFQYLESIGIDPNEKNNQGITPLFVIAQRHRDVAVIDYFIQKGNNVDQADEKGNTPLMNATNRSSLEIVTILANKTKNINAQNKEGKSALTNAVQNNSAEVVAFLLSKGSNIKVKDNKGNTLLSYLINSYSQRETKKFEEKWTLLKNEGLDLTQTQADGNTPYHIAVEKMSLPLLQKVANPSIDINAKDNQGLTPLIKAAMLCKDTAILKFLIEQGADKSITTDFGETAYDLAQENELLSREDINFLK